MKVMKQWNRYLTVVLTVSATWLGCAPPDADVDVTQSEIANGTVQTQSLYLKYGLVAIYNRNFSELGGAWWPRPCSGKIITSANGSSMVLTARHCVTTDGKPNGPLSALANVRLVASRSPGLANPEPPAGYVPTRIDTPAMRTDEPFHARDFALIDVPAEWSAHVASRQGFFLGRPTLLGLNGGIATYAYGYGITEASIAACTQRPPVTTGGGVARRGGPFQIIGGGVTPSGTGRYYGYRNSNAASQRVMCGDSGGPDVTTFGGGSFAWGVQLGVHSVGNDETLTSTAILGHYYGRTGGVFLSPYSSPSTNLTVVGNTVVPTSASWSNARFWHWSDTNQVVTGSNQFVRCLSYGVRSTDSTMGLIVEPCNTASANQVFKVNVDQLLYSGSGKCLTLDSSGTRVDLSACLGGDATTGAPQRWAWHPQP